MNGYRANLLENASATGTAKRWPGGPGIFLVEASAYGAGGTISLEMQDPAGTWVNVGQSTDMTSNGQAPFDLPPGQLRAAVAGGPPTAVYAWAIRRV